MDFTRQWTWDYRKYDMTFLLSGPLPPPLGCPLSPIPHSLLQSGPSPLPADPLTLSSQSVGAPLTSDLSTCGRRLSGANVFCGIFESLTDCRTYAHMQCLNHKTVKIQFSATRFKVVKTICIICNLVKARQKKNKLPSFYTSVKKILTKEPAMFSNKEYINIIFFRHITI